MSSEIYLIDNYANSVKSILSDSSTIVKVFFFAFFLLSIILTNNILKQVGFIITIFILIIISKVPIIKLFKWSIYPLVFALFFAISQAFYSIDAALLTIFRVYATVLLMLLFITTTGFINIASFIPSSTLRNTFILTYRFFFMIIDTLTLRLRIMKIRGNKKANFLRRLTNISNVIAHELLHTIDKAERVYKIMLIRGFSGKITDSKKFTLNKNDLAFALPTIMVIIIWLI